MAFGDLWRACPKNACGPRTGRSEWNLGAGSSAKRFLRLRGSKKLGGEAPFAEEKHGRKKRFGEAM